MAKIQISCAEKLVPAILACTSSKHHKRYVVLIGGRGSSKSTAANDCVLKICDSSQRVVCAREFQKSIDQSVHSALLSRIKQLGADGFDDIKTQIRSATGGMISYLGLGRNSQAIRSIHGIRLLMVDEAQFVSHNTLEEVLPSIRRTEDMYEDPTILLVGNPQSSADPFSQKFINPYINQLLEKGVYEDDDHLIIWINYNDNPWFVKSGLESERAKDEKLMPRALYEHKWLGRFNDSVDNSIILAEWFDACVDAHEKLNFKPCGEIVVAHDPADVGNDAKGLAHRHGSVIVHVDENETGDINEGSDWATDYAVSVQADRYLFDGDGAGIGLRQQAERNLGGKHTVWEIFKGSESPDNPSAIFEPLEIDSNIRNQATTNAQSFKNKRSQKYFQLRNRIYLTYRAVVHREMKDPEKLISFCSNIPKLQKLRSELCRLPRKNSGNGMFQVMPKPEMLKQTPPIPSPNMADSVMMTLKERDEVKQDRPQVNIRKYGAR